MEWAADEGADVVNMSLGGAPTDGTDPMSTALNTISTDSDVLFVVAAGNMGWDGHYTVGSPGAADLALTVGSVDSDDDIAGGSSRGPRLGDDAIKPEVTAPGVEIISALSADAVELPPIDEYYTEASGTSMAAPHVAGAAAILLQDRPDLSSEQLRALLMGSTVSTNDTVWEEGAGRIAIPAALDSAGYALPAALSFGTFAHPHDDLDPVTLETVVHNIGDEDLTLDLTVEVYDHHGEVAPAGTVELGADELTVPASGTAALEVTVDPTVTELGLHSGAVIGTDTDGATLRIPLGFHLAPELFDLTLTALDWNGNPVDRGEFNVFDMEEGYLIETGVEIEDGTATLQVPASTYLVTADTLLTGETPSRTGLIVEPNLQVVEDTEVTFDFADTELVTLQTHRPSDRDGARVAVSARDAASNLTVTFTSGNVSRDMELYTRATDAAELGEMEFSYHEIARAPWSDIDLNAETQLPYRYSFFTWADRFPADPTFTADDSNTAEVTSVYRSMAQVEAPDVQVVRSPGTPGLGEIGIGYSHNVAGPGTRVEYISADAVWRTQLIPDQWGPLPAPVLLESADRVYDAGSSATEYWMSQVLSTGLAHYPSEPALQRDGDTLEFDLPVAVDAHGFGSTYLPEETTTRLQVWADDEPIGDTSSLHASFEVPSDPATYTVVARADHADEWWALSGYSRTEWTFHSATAEDTAVLPILDLRFQPDHLSGFNLVTRVVDLDVVVTHQAGSETSAEVTEATLEWSDGDGWVEAELTEVDDGRYRTQIDLPPGVQTVDLRGSAVDSDGSTISTEVHDALGIESPVTRLAGDNRYETAAELALASGHSPHIYLTTGHDYPDALAIGGLAGSEGAPVLLTSPDSLSEPVVEAMVEIDTAEVTILGGTSAVSTDVEEELIGLGLEVERIGGDDRYHTAALLAQGSPTGGTVYVASGQEYADALAAGPLSAAQDRPVLLTRDDRLPAVSRSALEVLEPDQIVLVGGPSRVADEVLAELEQIAPAQRIGGDNRFHTAALLAEYHEADETAGGFDSSTAHVAAGHDWPDALAMAARAGAQDAPILLVREDRVPPATETALEQLDARRAIVLGGTAVVSDEVLEDLEVLLTPGG